MPLLTPKGPSNLEEYLELIDQALFEVDDTRAAMEYEMEGMEHALKFIDELERNLRQLRAALSAGEHVFGGADLPYMAIIAKQTLQTVPFKRLLEDINQVHRHGLAQ